MKALNRIGLGLLFTGIAIFFVEKISNLTISTWFATQSCGDHYMLEPDSTLALQGILTENACGFDADMYLVAFVVGLMLLGTLLIAISARTVFSKG